MTSLHPSVFRNAAPVARPAPGHAAPIDPASRAALAALIAPELYGARDESDLNARLAPFGYAMARTPGGRKLVTLPHGVEVMDLPATIAAR